MEAILLHPETSSRRALILALGTVPRQGPAAGAAQSLTTTLPGAYRNDPDCGIHSAAEWTLSQWGQREEAAGDRRRADQAGPSGRPPLVSSTARDRRSPSSTAPSSS